MLRTSRRLPAASRGRHPSPRLAVAVAAVGSVLASSGVGLGGVGLGGVAAAQSAPGGAQLVLGLGSAPALAGATPPATSAVVGLAATGSGQGHWVAQADGSVVTAGDAGFFGSAAGTGLRRPVVGMAATPSGGGYWLVAADGGIFAFGDARFLGSGPGAGGPGGPARRTVGMAATPGGLGYLLAAADGAVVAFGDAVAVGDATGAVGSGREVAALALVPPAPGRGPGYWLATTTRVVAAGALGPGVEGIQRRLSDLGFWGPVDGRFGALTTQQVYAFQKANNLPRDGQLNGEELDVLARAERPRPRSAVGYVVEVDKARQLLIVARDGVAELVFNTSTGNGARYAPGKVAVTPEGRFRVQRQIDGLRISELGALFRPKYFTGGYAVHGSPSIPPFPASHGCVRVSNAAIDYIWANRVMEIGTEVWVYS